MTKYMNEENTWWLRVLISDYKIEKDRYLFIYRSLYEYYIKGSVCMGLTGTIENVYGLSPNGLW